MGQGRANDRVMMMWCERLKAFFMLRGLAVSCGKGGRIIILRTPVVCSFPRLYPDTCTQVSYKQFVFFYSSPLRLCVRPFSRQPNSSHPYSAPLSYSCVPRPSRLFLSLLFAATLISSRHHIVPTLTAALTPPFLHDNLPHSPLPLRSPQASLLNPP